MLPAFRGLPGLPEYSLSTFGKSRCGFIVLQQDQTLIEALFLAADRKFIPILGSSSEFVPGSFFSSPILDGWF